MSITEAANSDGSSPPLPKMEEVTVLSNDEDILIPTILTEVEGQQRGSSSVAAAAIDVDISSSSPSPSGSSEAQMKHHHQQQQQQRYIDEPPDGQDGNNPVQVEYLHLEDYLSKNGITLDQSTVDSFQTNSLEGTSTTTTTVILTSPTNHQQVIAALVNSGGAAAAAMELPTSSSSSSTSTPITTPTTTSLHQINSPLLQSLIMQKTPTIPPPPQEQQQQHLQHQSLNSTSSQFVKLLPNSPVPIQVVKPQQKNESELVVQGTGGRKRNLSARKSSTDSEAAAAAVTALSVMASGKPGIEISCGDSSSGASSIIGSVNTSPVKRRTKNPIPDDSKDEKYWRRRQKNNMAAKRSRETRREKENTITLRAAFLEKEYKNLQDELEKARELHRELKNRLEKYESVDEFPDI